MAKRQSRLVLVTGGARAGKSSFALGLANETGTGGKRSFIATAQALDDDMATRIAIHRRERSEDWDTIEEPYHLDQALLKVLDSDVVIVDCLTLFVSNWLLWSENEDQCQELVRKTSQEFLNVARSQSGTVICVSNEVGLGIVPDTELGRCFRDLLGRVNQQFAAAADEVYLLIAGMPLRIKPTGN